MANKLSDNIWVTRKARINTEKRLNRNSTISQFIMSYYSLFLIIFSICNYKQNNNNIDLLLISSSIIVFALSIAVYSLKFPERASATKQCYLILDKLYWEAKKIETKLELINNSSICLDNESLKEFYSQLDKLRDEYIDVQSLSENHAEFDYLFLRFCLNRQKTTLPKMTLASYLLLLYGLSWRILFTVSLLTFPIALIYA